jgi:hypothetical protein
MWRSVFPRPRGIVPQGGRLSRPGAGGLWRVERAREPRRFLRRTGPPGKEPRKNRLRTVRTRETVKKPTSSPLLEQSYALDKACQRAGKSLRPVSQLRPRPTRPCHSRFPLLSYASLGYGNVPFNQPPDGPIVKTLRSATPGRVPVGASAQAWSDSRTVCEPFLVHVTAGTTGPAAPGRPSA